MYDEYLLSFHKDDLLQILNNKDNSKHYSININFIELNEDKPELARDLLNEPEKSLEEWDKAAFRVQMSLLKEVDKSFELKNNIHCRVLYSTHVARRGTIFPGNKEVGTFMRISGTVMRITAAKLLEYQRNYICVKCKSPSLVKADYSRKYMIKQPKQCTNSEGCSGTNLVHFGELDTDNCKDYQEIKIQEQVKYLGMGSVPSTMWVTLEDDLVDSCQPGDDVTITGTVMRRFGEFSPGKKADIDLVFKANHIQVESNNNSFPTANPESNNIFNNFWEQYEQNSLEGRDLILKSFCPEMYGLYPVKLAMATVLAGGCSIEDTTATGVRTRSESHLLLVGDPGTGKSQMLRFASKIIPRAVLTTGVGSTAAGLTVTAKIEQGEWQLEAGALVMADSGICCIDEFNSMKEHDRTTIHEAMEQQTISVAKASMVCKLNTRCSILAACNPKGNIDPTQTMAINIALPSPLLSRFDLVMILRDTVNQEWDDLVIDYILNGGYNISKLTDFGLWPIKKLQAYFKRIKKLQPKLTEDAELILRTYYNVQRRVETRNKARTTVRLLESLVRLSQGHARLMYHEKVQIIDSIFAIFLIDIAMDIESSILNLNTAVNSIFPERPNAVYKDLLSLILNKLQLSEILEKEVNVLNDTKQKQIQSRFFANRKQNVEQGNSCRVKEHNSKINTNTIDNIEKRSENEIQRVPSEDKIIEEVTNSNDAFQNQTNNSTSINKDNICEKTLVNNKNVKEQENVSTSGKNMPNNSVLSVNLNKEKTIFNKQTSKMPVLEDEYTNTNLNKKRQKKSISEKNCNKSSSTKKKSNMFESGFDESIFEHITSKPKDSSSSNSSNVDVFKNIRKPSNCKKGSSKDSLKSSQSSNSVENDLEALQLLPGVNDDFNIDLDMDWDSVDALKSQRENKSINILRNINKSKPKNVSTKKTHELSMLDRDKPITDNVNQQNILNHHCRKDIAKKRPLSDTEEEHTDTVEKNEVCSSVKKKKSSMFESGFEESIFGENSDIKQISSSSVFNSDNIQNTKNKSSCKITSLSKYRFVKRKSDKSAKIDLNLPDVQSVSNSSSFCDNINSGSVISSLNGTKNNIFGSLEDVDFDI